MVLSLSFSAFSAERIQVRKFAGLNTRLDPFEIQDGESPAMNNFVLDKAGALTKRGIFKKFNTTSAGSFPITSVYKFYTSGDVGYLICAGGTSLYQATANNLNNLSVTQNTVTANSHWAFESFTDGTSELVFAANNDVRLQVWDGTSDAGFYEVGDAGDSGKYPAENCELLKKHKSRLFAAGSNEYPYRIYYSSLTNGRDWATTGGTIDLPSYEKIIAIEVLSDILYIFTRTGIYGLGGDVPDEFYLSKTRATAGTHATKSVVVGDKVIFFLNRAGVFAFDGDQAVNISETIIPTIQDISTIYITNSVGLYDKQGKYWLSYTSSNGSLNDTLLVYDTVIKQWYMLAASFASLFRADGGTDKGELFAGASDNIGYLWQLQTSSGTESITHSTKTQLQTGVTFNTAFWGTEVSPLVGLEESEQESDGDTNLLFHFNGADAATSTDDASPSNHTPTFVNQAQLDTDNWKFPQSSLLLDGASDYITIPDHADWDYGTGDFTFDAYVYFTSLPASTKSFELILHALSSGEGAGSWIWRLYNDSGNYELRMMVYDTGYSTAAATWSTPVVNTWYHIAVVRSSGTVTQYVDGVSVGSDALALTMTSGQTPLLYIGAPEGGGASGWFAGYIDELRMSDTARWTSTFIPVGNNAEGTLISDNLTINAAGQSSLGAITWQETIPSNSDIQFTTRTGVTDDTTYDTWTEPWVSASHVSISTVSDSTVWDTSNADTLTVTDGTGQGRDILYYEPEDETNPYAVKFTVDGAISANEYSDTTVPVIDISGQTFIGFWLKSPVTGNSAVLSIGEVTGTVVGYITASTVAENVWEKHWWNIGSYTSTDIDAIGYVKLTYVGEGAGDMYLGDINAYDFLDNGDTITSTPNNQIQYRAMLATTDSGKTPMLKNAANYVVQLSYFTSGGDEETSLGTSWQSKIFDNQNDYHKRYQWVELTAESQTNNTLYVDYSCDDGDLTGTLSKSFETSGPRVTGRRVKMRMYFPNGVNGNNIQLTVRDDDKESELQLYNLHISFVQEGGFQ